MKSRFNYLLSLFLVCSILSFCDERSKYPVYSLETIEYVPDSLRMEHQKWIIEAVRAASYHMTGGEYDDPPATIRQATWTADDLFQVKVVGLRKEIEKFIYLN